MKKFCCLILLIATFSLSASDEFKYKLSIGTIFRDEAPYLREWIEYHRMLGVEHFYLVNHLSKDNYKKVLQPYIDAGIVDLMQCHTEIGEKSWFSIQVGANCEIISHAVDETYWLAIVDTDEFLVPMQEDNLITFLEEYDDFAGLVINWQMFGTSQVERIKSGELMVEKLTKRAKSNFSLNKYVKSIFKPKQIENCNSAHFVHYKPNFYAVNENKHKVIERKYIDTISIDKIRLNHYWTRDEHYWKTKKLPSRIQRKGKNEKQRAEAHKKMLNEVEDDTILRFVPELRHRMAELDPAFK